MAMMTVTIAHTKEVAVTKFEDVGIGEICILILFIHIVSIASSFCCKWKFSNHISYLVFLK